MYLSKVEIVGFKSFSQKTLLNFTDGLTAIVGPNGCGKTNIVDAIRWALGEQKTAVLRSDSMENVIFNGTRLRKSLGMAEVSLTIENNKKILPVEYSEVTITRRLFRNGESQYLLNKTQCRLRDIIDLFMDTGMGADAYSVIELKMVESILSDRTDERRHLFEEAAGVTKYKARRREAQRKLDSTQIDLSRVQDILLEVKKNAASLGRQADKARLYNELSEQVRLLEIDLLRYEFKTITELSAVQEAEFASFTAEKQRLQAIVEQAETTHQVAEQEQDSVNYQLHTAQEQENTLSNLLAQLSQQNAVSNERRISFEQSHSRLIREQAESDHSGKFHAETMSKLIERIEIVKNKLKSSEQLFNDLRQKRDTARENVQTLREKLRSADSAFIDANNKLSALQTSNERHQERVAGLRRRINENILEAERTAATLKELNEKATVQEQRRGAIEAAILTAEKESQTAHQRQTALRAEMDNLQTILANNKGNLAHKSASLEFLNGLMDTSESSVFLMKTPEWKPATDKALLAELVGADAEYRVAIEAALGEAGRYFVVETRSDAEQGCAALSNNSKGKATFICREYAPELSPPKKLTTSSDIIGWASEIVRCDDVLRNILRGFLGKTLVVATMEKAYQVIEKNIADQAVTLAGEIVRAGLIRGGARSKTEGLAVGKREQIGNLSNEIEELQKEISNSEQQFKTAKKEHDAINLRAFDDAIRRAEAEKNAFEQSFSQIRYRREALESAQQQQQEALIQFTTAIQTEEESNSGLTSEINLAITHKNEAHEARTVLQQEVSHSESYLVEFEQKVRDAEIELVQLRGEDKTLVTDKKRLEDQSANADRRTKARNDEIQAILKNIEELSISTAKNDSELSTLREERGKAKAQFDNFSTQATALKERYHALAEDMRLRRREYEKHIAAVHESELRLSQSRASIEHITRRAEEELKIMPEELRAELSSDFDQAATQFVHKQKKSKLLSLGNVNFLALEEFEKESERLNFLTTQVNDLLASEKTLNETIEEINTTAQQKFTQTFESIRGHFQNLFGMMFPGGGEANLLINDGDPLDASINIIAKPAGKRPQSIELLSAGEKTLTAIALLFAIYLEKPSPFCILDEVDAPLDDANIERYLQILRKFSENTQFLIITHNKKTMEAADILYGVTQEEEGVSRVVSVKMN
ncbi:MAG: chromosome segregation protein SMC [Bacteroidetes bacterium]|nr:chromosome segregation protein SMC [Bacteroidota bacterium]